MSKLRIVSTVFAAAAWLAVSGCAHQGASMDMKPQVIALR